MLFVSRIRSDVAEKKADVQKQIDDLVARSQHAGELVGEFGVVCARYILVYVRVYVVCAWYGVLYVRAVGTMFVHSWRMRYISDISILCISH